MSPTSLCILLFVIGVALILAELALPTHGMLGVFGGGAIVAAIGVAFYIHQWLGLTLLLGTICVAPFVATAAMNLWPKTPLGKRVFLQPVESNVQPPRVGIGQTGVAVSDLRPMGSCEFDDARHEARSEIGVIHAGRQVKVVSVEQGRLIVREV